MLAVLEEQYTSTTLKPRLHLASRVFLRKLPSKSKNPEGKM
jgi:hypothetical protein